jgi:hypothetical protein
VTTKGESLEQEIKRLKEELWFARHAVIGLAPKDVRSVLMSFDECKRFEDVHKWQLRMFEQVLGHAHPRPPNEMRASGSSTPRAYCPLCGGSAEDVYGIEGFAYPEGLKWYVLPLVANRMRRHPRRTASILPIASSGYWVPAFAGTTSPTSFSACRPRGGARRPSREGPPRHTRAACPAYPRCRGCAW